VWSAGTSESSTGFLLGLVRVPLGVVLLGLVRVPLGVVHGTGESSTGRGLLGLVRVPLGEVVLPGLVRAPLRGRTAGLV